MDVYGSYIEQAWQVVTFLRVPMALVLGFGLFSVVGVKLLGFVSGPDVGDSSGVAVSSSKSSLRPGRNSGLVVAYGVSRGPGKQKEEFINATKSAKASGMSEERWLYAHAMQSGQKMSGKMSGEDGSG